MTGTFTGQSGATAQRTATASCSSQYAGGKGQVVTSGSLRKGLRLKVTAPAGRRIDVLRISLPKGVRVPAARRTRSGVLKRAKGLRLVGRTLQVAVPKAGAASVTVKIPKGALAVPRALTRRSTVPTTVRVAYGGGSREVVVAKARP
ncbi:MAG: hypothetical protein PGN13_13825 [Patulibacter minatonensis]